MVPDWVAQAARDKHEAARIVSDLGGGLIIRGARGEIAAQISGRLRRLVKTGDAIKPVVGDWVYYEWIPDQARGQVHSVVPRRQAITRKEAGPANTEQVVAANVDAVFIVMSLNEDYNIRRLERFLAIVWEASARPIVVLSKADLCAQTPALLQEAQAAAPGAAVLASAINDSATQAAIAALLRPGETYVLLGSSGAGKSTLVNGWLGASRQATQTIREDGKGRHTTTHRQLFILPNGAAVIDTPGMRELGMLDSESGVREAFSDVAAFAASCRFADCKHESEPHCAVRAALASKELPGERFESFSKLLRELQARAANKASESRAARHGSRLNHRARKR